MQARGEPAIIISEGQFLFFSSLERAGLANPALNYLTSCLPVESKKREIAKQKVQKIMKICVNQRPKSIVSRVTIT